MEADPNLIYFIRRCVISNYRCACGFVTTLRDYDGIKEDRESFSTHLHIPCGSKSCDGLSDLQRTYTQHDFIKIS